MPRPLTLIAELKAKPAKAAELGQRLRALVAPTRAEAGCLGYVLHRSSDDTDLFVLYENWRSREDLDRHLAMPYLADFFARVPDLVDGNVAMRYFEPGTEAAAA
jgi:quinol monooxygenase YgiN